MPAVTAPFADRAATELPRGVGLTWEAYASTPLWPSTIDLGVDDIELVEDETMWPRCSAILTCPVPDDPAVLAALDPRQQIVTVDVYATYIYADGVKDRQKVASLLLQERRIINEEDAREVQLTLQSDEMLVLDQETGLDRGGGFTPHSWATANAAFQGALEVFTGGALRGFVSTIGAGVTLPSGYPMAFEEQRIADPVEFIRAWADSIDAVIYCDMLGVWRLEPAPAISPTSSAIIAPGPLGLLKSTEELLTRRDWANRVIITYDASAALAPAHSLWPITWTPQRWDRVYVEQRHLPAGLTPDPTWGDVDDPAAKALLARMLTRGASLTVGIIACLWLHVGNTVTVTTPTTPQQRALIAGLRTRADGSQTITTRQP